MREIKFRGKCVATDEWLYGYLVEGRGVSAIVTDVRIYEQDFPWVKRMYQVDADTVGQYTGLKDKNGREIYEGDVVKRKYLFSGAYGELFVGKVIYEKQYAGYVIRKKYEFIDPRDEGLANTLSSKSSYEVIGNSFENPELLGDDK